jgi:hypothetical protein
MTGKYPKIRLYRTIEDKQYLGLRESISICFYMRRSHQDVVQDVLRSLEVYRQAIGSQALAWYPDSNGDWQELNAESWKRIREEMSHPRGAYISLHGSPNSVTGYEFTYRGFSLDDLPFFEDRGTVCAVAFWLPSEYLEEYGPVRVRRLALELASGLPFNSGHAGLSLHFSEEGGLTAEEHRHVRDLAFRFAGLDIPALRDIHRDLGTRVKGVHWMTFLGQPMQGELGGVTGLRARLHLGGTTVTEMEGERAVVTLGEWPEAGELEKGQTLPAYRELAQVLEPWLYRSPEAFWYRGTLEEMRRWERRFLD